MKVSFLILAVLLFLLNLTCGVYGLGCYRDTKETGYGVLVACSWTAVGLMVCCIWVLVQSLLK